MENHILMLVAIFGFFSYSQASLPPTQCKRTYEKVGGFNDWANRAMPELLLNDRNVNSDKNDGHVLDMNAFEASIHSLACRCAAKAKEKGYKVFGLQYLGECWSGPTAEYNYSKYGAAAASKSYQFAGNPPCYISKEQECVGGRWINYVYRLKEKTCRTAALGLESNALSDSQMRASSEYNSAHRAANGRLHFRAGAGRTGAWSAKYNNAYQWLQMDFTKIAKITKIATQGRQDYNQWVKSYTLSYSRDGVFWTQYPEVLSGNSDRSTVVTHELKRVIYARYLRIRPKTWQGHVSLRAEVYGCTSGFQIPAAETCVLALGMQGKTIPDSSITASSMVDANHSPSRARLGTVRVGIKRGGWSARTNDANQWIQVDMGRVVKVTRIATQGRQDYNQWVRSYSLQYSLYGHQFHTYKGDQVLMANTDRNTIVGNNLKPAIIARYIRIRPKTWYGHVSMRFEIYGCTSGFPTPPSPQCGHALGLESHVLSDSQMHASSDYNSAHRAANGRLHFRAGAGRTGAWSAKYNNAYQWLQMDFTKIAKITKIATQGRQDYNQWVKSYTLSYSRDGFFWTQYPEVLLGNSDRSTVVTHELKRVIYARYLRIHPQTWQGHVSLRAEVYGCTSGFQIPAAETCVSALGIQGKTIPDSSITASSMVDGNHSPSRARLGTVRVGIKRGGWSARTNDANQWIQVDMGRAVKVTRIATQGRQDYNQWVRSYSLQYSLNGHQFQTYKGGQVLMANTDRNTIVGNNLEPAIIARYIRIRPKTWYGHVSMRFEIYGCTSGI